jgi:hypothetical protein
MPIQELELAPGWLIEQVKAASDAFDTLPLGIREQALTESNEVREREAHKKISSSTLQDDER